METTAEINNAAIAALVGKAPEPLGTWFIKRRPFHCLAIVDTVEMLAGVDNATAMNAVRWWEDWSRIWFGKCAVWAERVV